MYRSREKYLDKHRCIAFVKSTTRIKPDLLSRPPTKGPAKLVQSLFTEWPGNPLLPTDCGWTKGANGQLHPLTTLDPAVSAVILTATFCSCTKGFGIQCGCLKMGIHCSTVCGKCQRVCTNGPHVVEDSMHENDPPEPMDIQL